MKKQLFTLLAGSALLATSAHAVSYEYYQLYKDPKTMGAGGANVASGGSFSSVFSNPAGLSRIPKEYGWEFQLLNIGAAVNEDVSELSDIADAADESETAAAEVLEDLIGTKIHLGLNAVPLSIAKKFDKTAFGVGAFVSATTTMSVHQGLGSEGLLGVDALSVGGAALAFSRDIPDVKLGSYVLNNFAVGVGVKAASYATLSKNFTATDLANEEFSIEDETTEGSTVVGDLGLIYDLNPRFSVGLSAVNIGGIGEEDEAHIPMTVNIGGAYTYRVKRTFFNQVRVSADYIDLAQEYADESYIKRTRVGADLNVWDGFLSTFALQAGLYQGEYTAGLSLRLTLLELSVATYAEQMGAYAGQDSDRRYMGSIGINW